MIGNKKRNTHIILDNSFINLNQERVQKLKPMEYGEIKEMLFILSSIDVKF